MLHLLELSALTHLKVHNLGEEAADEVGIAALLTGLKQLQLRGLPQLADPALLQLTVLTGLTKLTLHGFKPPLKLHNKASRYGVLSFPGWEGGCPGGYSAPH
jgi:hypothetical protein